MTLKLFKSRSVLVSGFGVALAATLGSSAMGEFYRHLMSGEWTYETDTISEVVDYFEAEPIWNAPTYEHYEDDGSGFSLNIRQRSVLFRFSGTEANPFSFDGDPYFPNFNGWTFTDVDGTIAAFDSLTVRGKGKNVDWDQVDYGVINEDQFYVNFNGIAGTDLMDGNSFRLVMSFVPAPASALALFGLGMVRRRRT